MPDFKLNGCYFAQVTYGKYTVLVNLSLCDSHNLSRLYVSKSTYYI